MKKKRMLLAGASVLALVTGLSVSPAQAQNVYVPNPICVHAHSMSIDIMGMRQADIAIEVPQQLVESPLAHAIIEAAYDEEIVAEDDRAARIKEFANDMFIICDDALKGVDGLAI